MVQVVPPPGWQPKRTAAGRSGQVRTAAVGAAGPGVVAPSNAARIDTPPTGGGQEGSASTDPRAAKPEESANVAGVVGMAAAEMSPPPDEGTAPAAPSDQPVAAGAEDSEAWGLSPAGISTAERLWQKRLFVGAVPVAVLVIAIGAWSILSSGRDPVPPPEPVVEAPADPPPAAEPVPVEEDESEPLPVRLDRRWLPDETRLVLSLRISDLVDRAEFDLAFPLADPIWRPVLGRFLQTFGLRLDTIGRLTWACTDLAAWPDRGVIVIELEEGQDATVYRVMGQQIDIELEGEACRRAPEADWPEPFAILDQRTIVTGREDLLRRLADRSEGRLKSVPIDRLLKATAPDADVTLLLDLAAARQAGWRLPASLMDVWPAGRDAWHVVWEVPEGLGFSFRRGTVGFSELALACEGETAADKVHTALDELLPAARTAAGAQRESLAGKLQAGRITAAGAAQYEILLSRGLTALQAAQSEVVEETVWTRVDWGDNISEMVAAALGSRPAIRDDWLAAARVADEANHRRLLSGLSGYGRAEGHFPAGAGGGVLLPPETRLSWIATMLPYYGHADWHRELEFGYSWNGPQNRAVTERSLEPVVNPALGPSNTEAGFPVTHYVGVAGVGADAGELKPGDPRAGLFGFGRTTRLDQIPDGAANTMAILGVTERLGAWAAGGEASVRALTRRPYVNGPDGFGSGQPNGMLVGMADGSVRFISSDVDPTVLEQLATVGGGEAATVAALDPKPEPIPAVAPDGPSPELPQPAEGLVEVVEDDDPQPPQDPADRPRVDVRARLADRIPEIGFPGVPLVDAVEVLAGMSTLPISFDVQAMDQLNVSPRDPVTVRMSGKRLGEILQAVVSSRGLICVVEGDQILVTSPEEKRNPLRSVGYTVSDLTGQDPAVVAELAALVRQLVAPDSWREAGGRGTVEPAGGSLNVVQTDPVHYRILHFCEKLRSARGRPLRSARSRLDPDKFTPATRLDRARAKLERPVSANFHDPAPLGLILSDLEQLSGTTILIDWLVLGSEGTSPQTLAPLKIQERPLSEALDELLRPLGLAYRIVDAETLEVTTRKATAAQLELEFYPVGDLLAKQQTAPGTLVQRIKGQVAGSTWTDAGGPAVLHFDEPSSCLIVLQSQPVQVALESLLDELRTAGGEKP